MNDNNPKIKETLALAWQHHKKNNLQAAELLYKQILEIEPDHVESIFHLGSLSVQIGNLERASQLLTKTVQIDPSHFKALNNLGIVFQKLEKHQQAIDCYKKAIGIDPKYLDAYCNLAILYMNIGRHEEALQYCDQLLNLTPEMLKGINVKSKILQKNVPAWHVTMMNDNDRNNFYLSALKSVIKTSSSVFEIGTGSGLLSIMAANLGAHEINTCETNTVIASTAIKVIADNNLSEKINVITKKSNDIKVGKDINKPADVLVSEIFSSELLSEDVLPSLEDAKQRLISKNAKIIPEYGSIMISLFGGDDIAKNIYTEKFENIKLKKFNPIIPRKQFWHRPDLKIDLMSNVVEAFRFDFVNNNNFPSEKKKIEIEATKKGRSYGIIQWIKLEMENGLKYENYPANLKKTSGWQNVFYLFDDPMELSIGQKVVITGKHDRNIVWFFI